MKKLIIILSISCLFTSCYDYHHYIPKDKLPLLKNNDIIYFQDSASNKIDTFRLEVRNIWDHTNEGDYYQYIQIYYNKFNPNRTFLQFSITSASVDGVNFGVDDYSSKSEYDHGSITINFTIHGVTYPNVYVGHENTVLSTDTIPNKVYFSFLNGIIRYEYKDGRVYELMNK